MLKRFACIFFVNGTEFDLLFIMRLMRINTYLSQKSMLFILR